MIWSHNVFCFINCMTVIHQKRKIDLKKSSLTCLCGHFIVSYDCRGLGSGCFCGLLWWLHSSGEESSWGFGGTCDRWFWCRTWGYMRAACGRNSGLDWLCCCWNSYPKARFVKNHKMFFTEYDFKCPYNDCLAQIKILLQNKSYQRHISSYLCLASCCLGKHMYTWVRRRWLVVQPSTGTRIRHCWTCTNSQLEKDNIIQYEQWRKPQK